MLARNNLFSRNLQRTNQALVNRTLLNQLKQSTARTSRNMPLVVPGLSSTGNDKTSEWMNKLVGKKIGESSNETTFAKTELPEQHRVVKEGDMMTMDHNPNRLNVHTSADGTVTKVTHG